MSDLFGGALPQQVAMRPLARQPLPAPASGPTPLGAALAPADETPAVFGTPSWTRCRCNAFASIHFAASGLRRCMRCAIAEGRGYRTEHPR